MQKPNTMQKSESKFLPSMSRNTKLFGAISFLTDVSSEMIFPLLPFFLTGVLGAPAFVLGFMESIGEFTADRDNIGFYPDTYRGLFTCGKKRRTSHTKRK